MSSVRADCAFVWFGLDCFKPLMCCDGLQCHWLCRLRHSCLDFLQDRAPLFHWFVGMLVPHRLPQALEGLKHVGQVSKHLWLTQVVTRFNALGCMQHDFAWLMGVDLKWSSGGIDWLNGLQIRRCILQCQAIYANLRDDCVSVSHNSANWQGSGLGNIKVDGVIVFRSDFLGMFAPGLDQRFSSCKNSDLKSLKILSTMSTCLGRCSGEPSPIFALCFQTLANPPGNPAASLIDCQSSWRSLATVGGGK